MGFRVGPGVLEVWPCWMVLRGTFQKERVAILGIPTHFVWRECAVTSTTVVKVPLDCCFLSLDIGFCAFQVIQESCQM